MVTQFQLGEIAVSVLRKDIENVHLSVYPPSGKVRISAPAHMNLDAIRVFAISKLEWIKKQQQKIREQDRETPREYLERESHYLWGKRYLLKVVEQNAPPKVELNHNEVILHVRPEAKEGKMQMVISEWYRSLLKEAIPPLIERWKGPMGVTVDHFAVRKMKTKWGSCSPGHRTIRLNLELAKKPPECLEYIVAHEMVHLLEPTHNERFVSLMEKFMPRWRLRRDELNSLPVKHENWRY